MDTLPHNGAVITLLAVTGLTHRQAYKDVFVITMTKTAAIRCHRVFLSDRDLLRKHYGGRNYENKTTLDFPVPTVIATTRGWCGCPVSWSKFADGRHPILAHKDPKDDTGIDAGSMVSDPSDLRCNGLKGVPRAQICL